MRSYERDRCVGLRWRGKAAAEDGGPEVCFGIGGGDVPGVFGERGAFSPLVDVMDCVVPAAVGAALAG